MASRAQSLSLSYVAWNTNANAGKTGDAANHTLRWIKDGIPAPPANAPSEVDATNAPGIYKLALTAAESTCDVGVLAGKSATANVVIIPVTVTFEQLPTAAPNAAGGLVTNGNGVGQISLSAGLVTLAGVTHTGAVIPTVSALSGHTPQTGDSFARLGAPAGASVSADIKAIKDSLGATVASDALWSEPKVDFDFWIRRGDSEDPEFTVKNTDGTIKDIGSASAIRFTMREGYHDGPLVLQKSLGSGVVITDGVGGKFQVSLSPSDTAVLNVAKTYVYDAEVILSGKTKTVISGKIEVRGDVSH